MLFRSVKKKKPKQKLHNFKNLTKKIHNAIKGISKLLVRIFLWLVSPIYQNQLPHIYYRTKGWFLHGLGLWAMGNVKCLLINNETIHL